MILKKAFLFFSILIIQTTLFAQTLTKINNSITPQHEQVINAKFYMIPAEGFTQDVGFVGFLKTGTDFSILIREAAGSYKSLVQTFMTENLTVKGMKLISQEKFLFNGDDAALFKISQKVQKKTFNKYLFFFGDDEYCVLISSIFPENDKNLESEIRKSLLSVAYKEEADVAPQPRDFTLDFSKSNLKYARSIMDAVIYSEDGKTSSNALEKNSFFAGSGKAKTNDITAFANDRIKKQIKTALTIEKSNAINIAGLQGHEIIAATTNSEGKLRKIYQILLFEGEKYYVMTGSAIENIDAKMIVFQEVVKSFKK